VWDRITDAGNLSMPAYLALWTTASGTWTSRVLYDPGLVNGIGNEAFNNEIVILPTGDVLDFFTLLTLSTSTASLQVIRSMDHGATWSTATPVTVASIQSVGTTNPIPNGLLIRDSPNMAQVAADPNSSAVAAVWQQTFGSSTYDGIALSVSKDGGATWSAPKQVNGVKTVAAFSPTVRYLSGSDWRSPITTFVTTCRILGAEHQRLVVRVVGRHDLARAAAASPFDMNKAPPADKGFGTALFLGDNQGLALVGSNALPLYAATTSAGAHVYATQSPNPLTSSSAHVYMAAARRPLPAAAAANAQASVERMRLRAFSPPGRP